jgi:hypothetical protein
MRLIAIPAVDRHIRPAHKSTGSDPLDNVPESDETAIPFRRHPDLLVEQLRQPAAAPSRLVRDVVYRSDMRGPAEGSQGMGNGRVQSEPRSITALEDFAQRGFEQ